MSEPIPTGSRVVIRGHIIGTVEARDGNSYKIAVEECKIPLPYDCEGRYLVWSKREDLEYAQLGESLNPPDAVAPLWVILTMIGFVVGATIWAVCFSGR